MTNSPPLRIVTASSLFDGHDAAINLFRRLFQKAGCEVIHIGHNRSVEELVQTAIQEDVDALLVSSYQGGHMEYFSYLRELLDERGARNIFIIGGGGGTILPSEIERLETLGNTRIYHPEDGQKLGLKGIVDDALSRVEKCWQDEEFARSIALAIENNSILTERQIARAITLIEQEKLFPKWRTTVMEELENSHHDYGVVIGITGPGGAGKSSLVDELILRLLASTEECRIAILAFDPTKKMTGGALLGDRIRMNAIYDKRVFLRSLATKGSGREMSHAAKGAIALMKREKFDFILLETTGIGQGDAAVVELSDLSIYVTTSEYGASSQLEKIDMIDYADLIVVNKFDKMGAEDGYNDLLHAYGHSRDIPFSEGASKKFPVFATIASDFNDSGVTALFCAMIEMAKAKGSAAREAASYVDPTRLQSLESSASHTIIPRDKTFYLGEIAECIEAYHAKSRELANAASTLYKLKGVEPLLDGAAKKAVEKKIEEIERTTEPSIAKKIEEYHSLLDTYKKEEYSYEVRGKTIKRALYSQSLSNLPIPKIALPKLSDWGDILTFLRKENFPGHFPYTAGAFPLKNEEEEPRRQFAGEGPPERSNRRFHYLSKNDPYKRLSTAFDSVTLYGEDPDYRPDIYGKIGNSGVSIATLDDMRALFEGFDLIDPHTSVSLTINGPAPMILAMFFNAAIDFEVKKETGKEREELDKERYEKIRDATLERIRGTVQADILKEEQAQNTCIFSSKFAMKMMGDVEEYFIKKKIRNFYSLSISGYHIAEAGANPITQLAFTLANGFTIVEYYLARGMAIDDFAHNLSFFFSSGLDPEYTVIGRVARRIWAVVMKERYHASERSCKLKYHIQTSGRSLHAQEIAFNDIRTTLQALLALFDNCNSLHTNAYDEAITTPTEESVRRAMAIQLILSKEFGAAKCQNALQGSYFVEELTDLVEEAVINEFIAISRRGGVLGAMEKQYQRHRIQSESMKYEMQKASGELPIIGVNTFLGSEGSPDYEGMEVIRASDEEKERQIERCRSFIRRSGKKNQEALESLRLAALSGDNLFEELMETVKYCSLGQISHLLYRCGGKYRRSM